MKTKLIFLFIIISLTISCNKDDSENENLIPQYQSIIGTWEPLTISYDSQEVRVTHPIQYDRLVINSNLSYEIYLDSDNPSIEDGTISIISQTVEKLELFFDAVYPSYSSFAGSHIFGFSNVVLDAQNDNELILKSTDNPYFQNIEFRFGKY